MTWARRKAEANRVSTRRDMKKHSLVIEGVSRPPNSTNNPENNFEPYKTKRPQSSFKYSLTALLILSYDPYRGVVNISHNVTS